MRVNKVMTKKVFTIPSGTTVREGARLLVEKETSGAPVVDDQGAVIGIVSEKDLFRALYPSEEEFMAAPEQWIEEKALLDRARQGSSKIVDEVMTANVVAVTPDTTVIRVGAMMLARGIHRVLVMDQGALKGIVTRRDIYQTLFKRELKV